MLTKQMFETVVVPKTETTWSHPDQWWRQYGDVGPFRLEKKGKGAA